MRLAFVCHEYPPLGGGAASALERFTRVLAERGHEILVVTIGLGKMDQEERDGQGRHIVRLGVGRRTLLAPGLKTLMRSYLALRGQSGDSITRFKPDGVVAWFAFPAGHAVLPLVGRLGVPLVVSLRGSDVPGFSPGRWGRLGFMQGMLFKPAAKKADLLLANGASLTCLAEKGLKRSVINLPNGIDGRLFYPPQRPDDLPGPLRLLFVGQLIPRKRCLELLRGVVQFGEQGGRGELTLVGEGPLWGALEEGVGQMPPTVKVRLAGFIPREEMPGIYRQHDLLLHLSRAEGVSNVLLEGLSSGLGVVAAPEAVNGVVDGAGNAGGIQKLASLRPQVIGEALWRLDQDRPGLRAMQLAARQLAAGYSWEERAGRFEALMAQVGHQPTGEAVSG
ncbi:MAG: glycosyltransferase family 4 protein [Magnetococcales bacterium]|nr:glycosyltransferase family 4 protein [Magnetococcales bacterium]